MHPRVGTHKVSSPGICIAIDANLDFTAFNFLLSEYHLLAVNDVDAML